MHEDKKFRKLVFYMEACESGSMFKNLLADNIDVYATTASNASTRWELQVRFIFEMFLSPHL